VPAESEKSKEGAFWFPWLYLSHIKPEELIDDWFVRLQCDGGTRSADCTAVYKTEAHYDARKRKIAGVSCSEKRQASMAEPSAAADIHHWLQSAPLT